MASIRTSILFAGDGATGVRQLRGICGVKRS